MVEDLTRRVDALSGENEALRVKVAALEARATVDADEIRGLSDRVNTLTRDRAVDRAEMTCVRDWAEDLHAWALAAEAQARASGGQTPPIPAHPRSRVTARAES
jgi:hypothetical protein